MNVKKSKQYVLADFREEMKALESGVPVPPLPVHVFLGEAVDVARFFAKYWKTIEDGDTIVRYGLESVGDRLPASTGAEILAITELAQDAQSRDRLSVRGGARRPRRVRRRAHRPSEGARRRAARARSGRERRRRCRARRAQSPDHAAPAARRRRPRRRPLRVPARPGHRPRGHERLRAPAAPQGAREGAGAGGADGVDRSIPPRARLLLRASAGEAERGRGARFPFGSGRE